MLLTFNQLPELLQLQSHVQEQLQSQAQEQLQTQEQLHLFLFSSPALQTSQTSLLKVIDS